MAGVESSRIYNEVPAIQFRSLNQFVADLAAEAWNRMGLRLDGGGGRYRLPRRGGGGA